MLDVKLDRRDPTDLFEQVAAEIRRAIAEGEAKPGERLPPAKDLAAVLGVNTNTVLRSLRLLRDEGLLEFRRGRGISVAGTPELGAVVQRARELVTFARHHGYRVDELVEIIEDVGRPDGDGELRGRAVAGVVCCGAGDAGLADLESAPGRRRAGHRHCAIDRVRGGYRVADTHPPRGPLYLPDRCEQSLCGCFLVLNLFAEGQCRARDEVLHVELGQQ